MTETVSLAAGFRSVDRDEWRQSVAAVLAKTRGTVDPDEVERLLATPTDDGYAVQPLYTPDDAELLPPPALPGTGDFVRGADAAVRPGWRIRSRHWLGGPLSSTASDVAEDLANGVDELWLTVADHDALTTVLATVDLAAVPVVVEGFRDLAVAQNLLDATAALGEVPTGSSLGMDPIGLLAATGRPVDTATTIEMAHLAEARGIRAFAIDGTVYHDAGGSFAEELGAATAAGLATLRDLIRSGMDPVAAERLLEFRFAVTDEQFASLAKLRAARMIWARVLEVAGIDAVAGQQQHAVTSRAMLTVRDPAVNLIRNCVAAFAAGAGNALAVTVLPHTLATGVIDAFDRRMARNTQHLILEESHVGAVIDPAGGSPYIETRTRQLAEAGWSWLREIEAAGGIVQALDRGLVAHRIERTWNLRSERTARRAAPITGVSEFPDDGRSPDPAQEVPIRPTGGLPQHRYAEAFEALRDEADQLRPPPTVALVTIGSQARFGARETFAANLFGVAGIAAVRVSYTQGEPIDLPTGVRIACLCGADPDYTDHAAAAARAAAQAGAERVLLAGKPGERAAADAEAGITGHIYVGCNVLAILTETLQFITGVTNTDEVDQ